MSKCQVKDCENEAIGFICDHDEGEHDICQECIDKYFTREEIVIARQTPTKAVDRRETIDMVFGIALVYLSLVLETIYGAKNYEKIDKLICRFFDWLDGPTGYSNAQSFEDIP